jgi:hypothetical protein
LIALARTSALVFTFVALCAGTSAAAEDPAVLKDLTAVIVLLGLPCDQVASARRQADNSHIASCRNGDRYRVSVNAEGRVIAEKL